MEEVGICSLCGTPGKLYTCRLCGKNVCIYCISFYLICRYCSGGRLF